MENNADHLGITEDKRREIERVNKYFDRAKKIVGGDEAVKAIGREAINRIMTLLEENDKRGLELYKLKHPNDPLLQGYVTLDWSHLISPSFIERN
jgi:hypothetical protein